MSELLVFDGEELNGPIAAEDLSVLRAATFRGRNGLRPYVAGSVPRKRWLDGLDQTIVFSVTARTDPDGTPHTDREVGLEQNLEHYRTLFTTGGDDDTSEHEVELHYAGTVFAGMLQVDDYASVRTGPETARIVLRVAVAGGELLEVPGS